MKVKLICPNEMEAEVICREFHGKIFDLDDNVESEIYKPPHHHEKGNPCQCYFEELKRI